MEPSAHTYGCRQLNGAVGLERPEPARIAILASGQGSTFAALVHAGREAVMPAEVVLLITSRSDAPAVRIAGELGVEHVALNDKQLGAEECDRAMEAAIVSHRVDLIVLAGFVRKVGPRVLRAFAGQILNTHPAPLPRFGGKGMYGEHVHQAVLDAGVAESAATVHVVDGEYDTGPVIATQPVPVIPGDDVASLRARVQTAERELLIPTLRGLTRPSIPNRLTARRSRIAVSRVRRWTLLCACNRENYIGTRNPAHLRLEADASTALSPRIAGVKGTWSKGSRACRSGLVRYA